MSNTTMSPVFEKEGCDHILKRTVILPATKRVASIQAEDNKNRKIDSYNPRMGKFDGALFTVYSAVCSEKMMTRVDSQA